MPVPRFRRRPLQAQRTHARTAAPEEKGFLGFFKEVAWTLGKAIIFVAFAVGCALLFVYYYPESAIVEPFSVPKELSDLGYTSQAVTGKLIDEMGKLVRAANTDLKPTQMGTPGSESIPDIELPETHTSLKSLVAFLQGFVGKKQAHVSGEVTRNGKELTLTVRVSRGDPDSQKLVVEKGDISKPNELVERAARSLLRQMDPYMLASALAAKGKFGNETIALLQECIDDDTRQDRQEYARNMRALMLNQQGNYRDAEDVYRYVIKRDPSFMLARWNLIGILSDQGRLSEADDEARKAAEAETPRYHFWGTTPSAGTLVAWADVVRQMGDFDRAGRMLNEAWLLDPSNPQIATGFGWLLRSESKFAGAYSRANRAAYQNPDDPDVQMLWSQILYDFGMYKESKQAISRSIDLWPGYAVPYSTLGLIETSLGNYKKAYELEEKASKMNPSSSDIWDTWGYVLADQGYFKEAIDKYNEALMRRPVWPDYLDDLGETRFRQRFYPEALDLYTTASQQPMKGPYPLIGLGRVLTQQEHYQDAIEKYQQAARMQPGNWYIYINWGDTLAEMHQFDEAERQYETARRLRGGSPDASSGLGDIRKLQRDYEGAIWLQEDALNVDPNYYLAHVSLGNIYAAQKRYALATREFKLAIKSHPRDPNAYQGWGNMLRDQKQYAAAAAQYKAALDPTRDPRSFPVLTDWGELLFRQKNYKGAIEKYKKAFEFNDRYALAHTRLGNVYAAQKQYDKAVYEHAEALRLNPGLAVAYVDWGNTLALNRNLKGAEEKYHQAIAIDGTGETGSIAQAALDKQSPSVRTPPSPSIPHTPAQKQ
jgi:tetratricopeptide (TPR) repeat protein